MTRTWAKLGGQLGLGCVAIGFLLIGLAWNGAAGIDFVQGQVPYLLSGGALGLGLVVVGSALVVVQSNRRDRSLLEAQLRELNTVLSRLAFVVGDGAGAGDGRGRASRGGARSGPADAVVLGRGSYHRPGCRLVQGKDLPSGSVEMAEHDGLTPCRVCNPATLEALDV